MKDRTLLAILALASAFLLGRVTKEAFPEEATRQLTQTAYDEGQIDALEGRQRFEKIFREDGTFTVMPVDEPDVELAYHHENRY
jgi:hypothetical protein